MKRHASFASSQKGSALFIILIGVALFAALGYAVSNMMQGSGGVSIGDEQSKLYAGEILDYGRNMRQAVQAMRIDGCQETEISFENQIVSGYTNGTNTDCQIFSPDGGGMNYAVPSVKWLDGVNTSKALYGTLFFSGETCVQEVGTSVPSTSCLAIPNSSELVMFIPYIKKSICTEIAQIADVLQPSGAIPIDQAKPWNTGEIKFTGNFTTNVALWNNAAADSSLTLEGKNFGCFEASGSGGAPASDTYHFYQVLIAR